MRRDTLDDLLGVAELARARGRGELVEVHPVTLRSLIDAAAALLEHGPPARLAVRELVDLAEFEGAATPAHLEQLQQLAGELELAVEVARARFVDEHVEPALDHYDPALHERARRLARREAGIDDLPAGTLASQQAELAAAWAELRAGVADAFAGWGRQLRNAWRRGRSQ